MGADIKALRTSIRSVDNMLHLTSAMGLVASSKIRRANDAMLKGREYAEAVKAMTDRLTASPECEKSPFMRKRHAGSIRLIVIAGDRGLCGGYNANVFRLTKETITEAEANGEVEIFPIG
ncbi:MAG: F0F1 ATP synthase subunit gamma, partial [Clostridia bacterium]|nr:F0F1 ATP synthase subunit gamma [Clostridia bacterium]